MILYSLKNSSFVMDIYEDKVILQPRLWKSMAGRSWSEARVLSYAQIKRVELNKKLWPVQHQLVFHTDSGEVVFRFRQLYPFFERLKLYLERQIIRYYNEPNPVTPLKTVIDLLEEKKQRKKSDQRPRVA